MGAFKDLDIELQVKGVVPQPNYVTVVVHERNYKYPEIKYDITTYYISSLDNKLMWYIDPDCRVRASIADLKQHFTSKYQHIIIQFALQGNETARRILALLSEEVV